MESTSRNQRAIKPVSKLVDKPLFETDDKPAQVSDLFNGALNSDLADSLPDTIIRSANQVCFAVHARKVSYSSTRAFGGLLPLNAQRSFAQPTRLILEEQAEVINLLMHTIYGISADAYAPSLQTISDTLEALRKYGLMPLPRYIYSGTPLFNTIVLQADHDPLEAYAIAAEQNLDKLAIDVSSKTLHLTLLEMPDALVKRMGTRYLGRLYRLHGDRMDKMKELLNMRPRLHQEGLGCSKEAQVHIRIDFMLACRKLMWKAPNVFKGDVESQLGGVVHAASCLQCKNILQDEYDQLMKSWTELKTSI